MHARILKDCSNFPFKIFRRYFKISKHSQLINQGIRHDAAISGYETFNTRLLSSSGLSFFDKKCHGLISQNPGTRVQLSNRYFAEKFDRLLKTLTEDTEKSEEWGDPEKAKLLLFITSNFYDEIKKYDSLLVFFQAKWCGHCKKLKGPYAEAALMLQKANISGTLAVFDIMSDPDVADKENIVGVPVLKYFRKGQFITIYTGKRTADDIFQFMKDPPTRPIIIKRIEI